MPSGAEVGGSADPRQLQELRRVEGAAGQDHLAGLDRLRPAALPFDLDADRPLPLEVDAA